jgi:uncharacterized protein HemX
MKMLFNVVALALMASSMAWAQQNPFGPFQNSMRLYMQQRQQQELLEQQRRQHEELMELERQRLELERERMRQEIELKHQQLLQNQKPTRTFTFEQQGGEAAYYHQYPDGSVMIERPGKEPIYIPGD